MTLYACPCCGRVPEVTVSEDGGEAPWLAECDCITVRGSDRRSLEFSWTLYCLKMAQEMDP